MTSHEAELQSKLTKARAELNDLENRVKNALKGMIVTIEYNEWRSCEQMHTEDIYHPGGHKVQQIVTGRIIGMGQNER